MAIAITPKITGQELDTDRSYAYLYEPLPCLVTDPTLGYGYTFNVSINVYELTDTASLVKTYGNHGTFEPDSNKEAIVDYMALLRDAIQEQWFKIGQLSDIKPSTVITPNVYDFSTNYYVVSGPVTKKVILIGGRGFQDFSAGVDETTPLTEWEVLGYPQPDFLGYPKIVTELRDPTGVNVQPYVTRNISLTGKSVCGAYLIWKSKYGGWCTYGFDFAAENKNIDYQGDLEVNSFTYSDSGYAHIPTNYTGIKTSRSTTVRSIGVPIEEAKAIQGILESPAIYIYHNAVKLELVRLTGSSIPVDTQRSGSTVELTLSSIDINYQQVR